MVWASPSTAQRLTEMEASSIDSILPNALPFGISHRTNSPGRKIKYRLAMQTKLVDGQMNWCWCLEATSAKQKTVSPKLKKISTPPLGEVSDFTCECSQKAPKPQVVQLLKKNTRRHST